MERQRTLAEKVGFYSLWIGIISVFVGAWIPFFNYISVAGIAISYVTNLWREWDIHKKVDPVSIILCVLTISWLIGRQFVESQYILLFGQVITYLYLMHSSKKLIGKINRRFLITVVCSLSIGVMRAVYPSTLTNTINLVFSIGVLLMFVDPILEKIALDHRAKRLANEAKEDLSSGSGKSAGATE